MEINDILDPEEMDLVAGGRSLPESIIKKFTRQEKAKGTPPEIVYHRFADVGTDGYYLGTEAMYKREVKAIVEKEYGVPLKL